MRLNFNEIPTLHYLLSPETYAAYRAMLKGGLIDPQFGPDTQENKDVPSDEEIHNNTIELLAFNILRRSLYYTPVKTGTLRDSIYIKKYGKAYEIGYTAEYAVYVHEIEYNRHNYPWQYKFLEDAAFEVLEDYFNATKTLIPMTIQYNPLRVFIGEEDTPGESLINIKWTSKQTRGNVAYYKNLLNNFLNFDPDTASDSDRAYYNKMKDFFDFYRSSRKLGDWAIIDYWVDRNRHGFV